MVPADVPLAAVLVRAHGAAIGPASDLTALLAAVATVNDVRVVWHEGFGFATMVGFPVELDLTELTFTSLLVQMTRSMTAATSTDRSRTRAPAFRRAFVLSYAQRIGERLAAAKQRATAEASSAGDSTSSTAMAALGPTPWMACSSTKALRSSRVAKP